MVSPTGFCSPVGSLFHARFVYAVRLFLYVIAISLPPIVRPAGSLSRSLSPLSASFFFSPPSIALSFPLSRLGFSPVFHSELSIAPSIPVSWPPRTAQQSSINMARGRLSVLAACLFLHSLASCQHLAYDYGFDVSRLVKRQEVPFVVRSLPSVNGTWPVRQEVRQLEKNKEQWTLYILGLSMMQFLDQSEPLSWYQISGMIVPNCARMSAHVPPTHSI